MTDGNRAAQAMQDPGRAFASPEAVVAESSLPAADKRSILERWRDQLAERDAPATDEPDLATRIGRALGMLDTETGAHEVAHDQGFYTSVADIRKS